MIESVAPLPQTPSRLVRGCQLTLAAVVLIFGFLAASFAARNSDVWLHLASGRELSHHLTFGTDSFAYTTDGIYWANHSWLFDLGLYTGYVALGGAGLVVLKALSVAVLAAVMLAAGRTSPSREFWISAGSVALALLAMSPRLQLQPVSMSLLFLAVCLWLLRTGGRAHVAIPVVIAVWSNLDSWSILGPLIVALYSVGSAISSRVTKTRTDSAGPPIWLLPACLLGCLCTPFHVHGLELPAELSPALWQSDLNRDVRVAAVFASPWHMELLGRGAGYNPALWAFMVLLLLGLVSFAVNRKMILGWSGLIWLVFAVLAAWQIRLIPFFAVVAGPITAWNFRTRPTARVAPSIRGTDVVGGLKVLVGLIVLCVAAWPGWLQGWNRHDRPMAWGIEADPSLQRVAQVVEQWRRAGQLAPGDHAFATHPDVANYLAWFCPGERSFLDSRLRLFTPVIAEYETVCLGLDPTIKAADAKGRAPARETPKAVDEVLQKRGVACVILYDPDFRRLALSLRTVAQSPDRWEILSIQGEAVVVRWKGRSPGQLPTFDASREAFAAASATIAPAPETGPPNLARPLPWWIRFLERPTGSDAETNSAAVYLLLSEDAIAPGRTAEHRTAVSRHMSSLIGMPALPAPGLPVATNVASRLVGASSLYLPELQERSPALPLLAIRSARRAIASHPDDAAAWFTLAKAYQSLSRTTTEGTAYDPFPPLVQVRQIQIVTALIQAVTINPDLASAHDMLAAQFTESAYYDLALKHREKQWELARRAGRAAGEDESAFAERIQRSSQEIESIRHGVQDRENRYAIRAQSLSGDPLARARLALQLGLANKALEDVLLRVPIELYGADGIPHRNRLLLELLLLTGRSEDVRDLLDTDELRRRPASLGYYELPGGPGWSYSLPAYEWCDLCRAAAAGDYRRASAALESVRNRIRTEGDSNRATLVQGLALRTMSEVGLGAMSEAAFLRQFVRLERESLSGLLMHRQFLQLERADLHVLEGMLLVESGRPGPAAAQWERAQEIYQSTSDAVPGSPGRYIARRYLDRMH